MTDELRGFLDGVIVSDGSYIKCGSLSSFLQINLVGRNEDWIDLIRDRLEEHGVFCIKKKIPAKQRMSKGNVINQKESFVLRTLAYRTFLPERNRWYPNGKKMIPEDLDVKNPEMLAGWLMGDGNHSKKGNRLSVITLCTHSFPPSNTEKVVSRLRLAGFSGYLGKGHDETQRVIHFTGSGMNAFIDAVVPYVTPSFRYKTEVIRWVPKNCVTCKLPIGETNYRKWCDLCTPKSSVILRRSRNNHKDSYNELRFAQRRVQDGTAKKEHRQIVEDHEKSMAGKSAAASARRAKIAENARVMKEKISTHRWPSPEKMKELVELTSASQLAKLINVSIAAVCLKCKQWGITVKPAGYWSSRKQLLASEISY